jgi:hypothetical protein
MFCPSCGIEERGVNQYCRACGTDLRPARKLLEIPDSITASATTAREEIGRAFAAKIRDVKGGKDLAVIAEEVLPEIEKFLESPAEKRLRRMRTGTSLMSIGVGAAIGFAIASSAVQDNGLLIVSGLGVVCFFIGLSYLINGYLLTVPRTGLADHSAEGDEQRLLDKMQVTQATNELKLPPSRQEFVSVTDETTRTLADKDVLRER